MSKIEITIYYQNGSVEEINTYELPYYDIEPNTTLYSDRLWQWDSDKYNKCNNEVFGNTSQYFNISEHKKIEKFLSLYLDKPVKLVKIKEEINVSNGYPYWRFDCYR